MICWVRGTFQAFFFFFFLFLFLIKKKLNGARLKKIRFEATAHILECKTTKEKKRSDDCLLKWDLLNNGCISD
jgi:hypothetical protein